MWVSRLGAWVLIGIKLCKIFVLQKLKTLQKNFLFENYFI